VKGSELKVGLEVALPGTTDYRSRDYDHLGKSTNLRAIILDDRRVWRQAQEADGSGEWIPRPVGDEVGRYYGAQKARYAVAVEHDEVVSEGDDFRRTGLKVWEPHLASARVMLGTWAEHLEAAEVLRARTEEGNARRAADAVRLKAWADRVELAFRLLGIDYRPPEADAARVGVPVEVLDKLADAVQELGVLR
jgi:hypothetical protein